MPNKIDLGQVIDDIYNNTELVYIEYGIIKDVTMTKTMSLEDAFSYYMTHQIYVKHQLEEDFKYSPQECKNLSWYDK